MRNKPTVLDFIIITAVLLTAALLFALPLIGGDGQTLSVSVRSGGATSTVEYPLGRDASFELENNGIRLTVVISDGRAYVSESDCENRVCVKSGEISREGESIICAPAGISLRVTGGGKNADAAAG